MKLFFFLFLSIGFSFESLSDTTTLVKYTPNFKFKEGIYFNHNDFKNNKPLPCERIIFESDCDQNNFYQKLLQNKVIKYLNFENDTVEIESRKIWGYCKGNSIYVLPQRFQFASEPARLIIIGRICTYMLTESNSVGPGGSGYSYNSYKAVEYMMNFETGSYQVLTKSLIEEYLIADDELYKEYKKN